MALANGAFALAGGSTAATAPARVARSRGAVSGLGSQRDGGRGAPLARAALGGAPRVAAAPASRVASRVAVSAIGGASSPSAGDGTGSAPSLGASFNRGGSASSSAGASPSQLNAASSVGPGESSLYRAYREGAAGKSKSSRASPPRGSGSWDEDVSASSSFDTNALPLKINQDILLWNARSMRAGAMKIRKRDDRVRARLNAIRLYERAKAVDPSDGRAYVGMGQVLRQLGDVDAARQVYQDGADATGGDSAYIWQAWATLEEREGDVAKARQLYDAAVAADKTHAAAWHGWAVLEKKQGNFQRARDLLIKGSRLVPASKANPYLFQELGVMAMERGRVAEAREHFREGTRTEAGARSAVLWQAWAMLETREPDGGEQARKLFQKGLAVDPENKYVYLSWAVYEARCGYVDRARSLLRKGCKLNPGDPPLLQALARLEAKEGNLEAARALFEQGTKLDPLHQANWQAWAIAEWKAGHVDRARELLQRGVWVAPRSRNACKLFQAWGVLEEREGNVALARQLYKCGVKADPTSETTWLTWAKMEERQENPIRAQELRTLCVQQRAEALVGQSDLSPAAMFGIDSALRPVLTSLAKLLGGQDAAATAESVSEGSVKYGKLRRAEREVIRAEPLFGVMSSVDEA
jgi:tetratricopeptide (TPR) repeat protein